MARLDQVEDYRLHRTAPRRLSRLPKLISMLPKVLLRNCLDCFLHGFCPRRMYRSAADEAGSSAVPP